MVGRLVNGSGKEPLRHPFPLLSLCICRKQNDEARAAGKPVKYMYRSLYCPEKGMFCSIPETMINISGQYVEVCVWAGAVGCCLCVGPGPSSHTAPPRPRQPTPEPEELAMADDGLSLTFQGKQYNVGDYVYLDPYTFVK